MNTNQTNKACDFCPNLATRRVSYRGFINSRPFPKHPKIVVSTCDNHKSALQWYIDNNKAKPEAAQ